MVLARSLPSRSDGEAATAYHFGADYFAPKIDVAAALSVSAKIASVLVTPFPPYLSMC